MPSRSLQPAVIAANGTLLELAYAARRSPREDWRLMCRSFGALLASRGNIKARKPPDPGLLP